MTLFNILQYQYKYNYHENSIFFRMEMLLDGRAFIELIPGSVLNLQYQNFFRIWYRNQGITNIHMWNSSSLFRTTKAHFGFLQIKMPFVAHRNICLTFITWILIFSQCCSLYALLLISICIIYDLTFR